MRSTQQCNEVVGDSLWWAAMLAIGIASVANALIYALASLFGVELRVALIPGQPPQPLALGLVVFTTVLAALLATGLLAVLLRVTDRPVRTLQWIALVVLVLSLAGPLFQAVGATATLLLILMHLMTAGVVVGVLSTVRRHA
ncbi:MAG: DUF6069 family protein [Chloroflexota bacterium]